MNFLKSLKRRSLSTSKPSAPMAANGSQQNIVKVSMPTKEQQNSAGTTNSIAYQQQL